MYPPTQLPKKKQDDQRERGVYSDIIISIICGIYTVTNKIQY